MSDKREYKRKWHTERMKDPEYRARRNEYNRRYRAERSAIPKKDGHKFCQHCCDFHPMTKEFFYARKNSTTGFGKCKKQHKAYVAANRDKKNAANIRYHKKKMENDLNYRLRNLLRVRLNKALRGNWKVGSAVDLLGCSVDELKTYLESQFKPGMSWNNHTRDGWHIDHIEPLSAFDLTDKEQLAKACHYSNLQPLWSEENWSKGGVA